MMICRATQASTGKARGTTQPSPRSTSPPSSFLPAASMRTSALEGAEGHRRERAEVTVGSVGKSADLLAMFSLLPTLLSSAWGSESHISGYPQTLVMEGAGILHASRSQPVGSWMQTGEHPTHMSRETPAPPPRAWRLSISWAGLLLALNLWLGAEGGVSAASVGGRETCSLGLVPPPEPGQGTRKASEEFPLWLSRLRNRPVSMRMWVRDLALFGCGVGLQLQLRFDP